MVRCDGGECGGGGGGGGDWREWRGGGGKDLTGVEIEVVCGLGELGKSG